MINLTKLISANINRLWITKIRPLWLREKFFWKLYDQTTNFLDLFEQATLEFSRQIKLKIISTDIGHKQIASVYTDYYHHRESICKDESYAKSQE